MNMRKFISLVLLAIVLFFPGCYLGPLFPTESFVPVYGSMEQKSVRILSPREVTNPGKIYVYGKYLLVNEISKGIHVFNNESPSHPQPIAFIQLLGNTDMAMKDSILYADYMGNLIALATEDFSTIEEKGNLSLQNWNYGVPPPAGHYYECVDPEKGLVVSWKKFPLKNPECYAFQ